MRKIQYSSWAVELGFSSRDGSTGGAEDIQEWNAIRCKQHIRGI